MAFNCAVANAHHQCSRCESLDRSNGLAGSCAATGPAPGAPAWTAVGSASAVAPKRRMERSLVWILMTDSSRPDAHVGDMQIADQSTSVPTFRCVAIPLRHRDMDDTIKDQPGLGEIKPLWWENQS